MTEDSLNDLLHSTSNGSAGSLDPEPKRKVYTTHPDFLFVKHMAMERLFEGFQKKLSLFLSGVVCLKPESEKVVTPHNMFSWSKRDLIARRKNKDMSWFYIFILELSEACMEIRKLQIDIKELMKFAKLLYGDYRGLKTDFSSSIQSALEFLTILEDIEKEFDDNYQQEMELSLARFARTVLKEEHNERNAKINELEYIIFESDVFIPIQTRYQMRYYNNVVEQFEDEQAMKQNGIRKQIGDIETQMSVELYCSQCTIDALYAEINNYKVRIEEMTTRLAKESEDVESQISYKRTNIDRMRTQHSFLKEQIHRFKEEIVQLRLKEIKEAQHLQRNMEEKQIAEEAKVLAKKDQKMKPKKKK